MAQMTRYLISAKLLNDILNNDTANYHKIWYSKPFAIEK